MARGGESNNLQLYPQPSFYHLISFPQDKMNCKKELTQRNEDLLALSNNVSIFSRKEKTEVEAYLYKVLLQEERGSSGEISTVDAN